MNAINVKFLLSLCFALAVPVAGTLTTDAPLWWPLSVLFYSAGLFYTFSPPGNARKKVAYIGIAASLFAIELAFFFSFYLQNAGFNDAFFYHLRPDLLFSGVGEHLPLLLAISFSLAAFLALSTAALSRQQVRQPRLVPVALAMMMLGFTLSPPLKELAGRAVDGLGGAKGDPFARFDDLRGGRVAAEFVKGQKPNIVFIYAESLDHRYFDENLFPGLLPNLKRIRGGSIDFTNVEQGVGAGWTLGGIVASQCGYPLAVAHDIGGNDMGLFNEFLPKATCLGDLLAADGYHLAFIGGADARFAGKDDFLRSHGYSEVIDRDGLAAVLTDPSYQNTWGAFDDTLFDYAIRKYISLASSKSPFMLTVLTMDTHHPNGFLSRSCGTYGNGRNSSLNALHCADRLIPRFIEQIRNSPFSDNTVIVVMSDHLTMRNQASHLLERSALPERLTFFVNTPDGRSLVKGNAGVHYDVAPTILDLVGYRIKGQMGFGAPLTRGPGYLSARFGEERWQDEADNLLAIAGTLWNDKVTLDATGITFGQGGVSLNFGGREFNLHSLEGYSQAPTPIIFVFDANTLGLQTIKTYPFDQNFAPGAMSEELWRHQDKLTVALGRARSLPGFADPRMHPDRMVFFVGKPGGKKHLRGAVTGNFTVPRETIEAMAKEKVDGKAGNEKKSG